jgi:hypothetical protein
VLSLIDIVIAGCCLQYTITHVQANLIGNSVSGRLVTVDDVGAL